MLSGKQDNGDRTPMIGRLRQDALAHITSLRNDWDRVARATPPERPDICAHMRHCIEELMGLVRDLEANDA